MKTKEKIWKKAWWCRRKLLREQSRQNFKDIMNLKSEGKIVNILNQNQNKSGKEPLPKQLDFRYVYSTSLPA